MRGNISRKYVKVLSQWKAEDGAREVEIDMEFSRPNPNSNPNSNPNPYYEADIEMEEDLPSPLFVLSDGGEEEFEEFEEGDEVNY